MLRSLVPSRSFAARSVRVVLVSRAVPGARAGGAALALLALALTASAAPQPRMNAEPWVPLRADVPPAGEAVPKRPTAREQLEYATGLKTGARGQTGAVRDEARAAAVRAYRAVRENFPGEKPVCAEAAFRAGELLRSGGDTAGALAEFRYAREQGGETPFRVRALLEIGHVERRAQHFQDALTAYEGVSTDAAATPGQKDGALLWAGNVYAELGRPDDARRAWTRVAESAEDPLDRVRAYDQLALAAVARGELEGAAGLLERCREALADTAAEETKLGERVRAAVADMRAHDVLQRAVAKRVREREQPKPVSKP